ncbi:MAG TPA: hypothetical protein VGQ86_08040, partial [Candidatus Limnocylindria bacterium]|nr:hypothetical protein [Candidatus Limnocylindria bacterium]
MREGLAREFPEAEGALEAVRAWIGAHPVRLSREPFGWALIAAVGAGALASAATSVTLHLLSYVLPFSYVSLAGVAGWAGIAIASAVAIRSGGPAALLGYVAVVLVDLVARIPGLALFCERSGPGDLFGQWCTPQGWLVARWVEGSAVALGIIASRAIASGPAQPNVVFRVVGTLAACNAAAIVAVAIAYARSFPTSDAGSLPAFAVFVTASFIGAAAAGTLLGRLRARTRVAMAALVAILLVPWAISLQLAESQLGYAYATGVPPAVSQAITISFALALASPPLACAIFVVA